MTLFGCLGAPLLSSKKGHHTFDVCRLPILWVKETAKVSKEHVSTADVAEQLFVEPKVQHFKIEFLMALNYRIKITSSVL